MVLLFCLCLLRSGKRGPLWSPPELRQPPGGQRRIPCCGWGQAGRANPRSTRAHHFQLSDALDLLQKSSLRQCQKSKGKGLKFRKPHQSEPPLLCVLTSAALLLLCLLPCSPFHHLAPPAPLWLILVSRTCLCIYVRFSLPPSPLLLVGGAADLGASVFRGKDVAGIHVKQRKKKSYLIAAMTCGWRSSVRTRSVENVTVFADWGPEPLHLGKDSQVQQKNRFLAGELALCQISNLCLKHQHLCCHICHELKAKSKTILKFIFKFESTFKYEVLMK